jgi:excinuclease ABC subunit A
MSNDKIIVRGARVHNLKNVTVEIPRHKLVVITGLSGSGKSSLAFDTIYAEGQRRYAESFSAYARQFLGILDKPDVDQIEGLSPTISIDQRTVLHNPRSTVGTLTEIYDYLRLLFARIGRPFCVNCGQAMKKETIIVAQEENNNQKNKTIEIFICPKCSLQAPKLEPRLFSFNSPFGACSACKGLGSKLEIDPELLIPNKRLSLAEGALQPWPKIFANQPSYWQMLERLTQRNHFSVNTAVQELSKSQLDIVLYGEKVKPVQDYFIGAIPLLEKKHEETDSDYLRGEIEKYMRVFLCPTCRGKRLRKEALTVLILGKTIADFTTLTVADTQNFFDQLSGPVGETKLTASEYKIAKPIFKELKRPLGFLIDVGLDYLTLDRVSLSLAGGEAQRLRLANQISSALTGVIYILDEPSIGLHARDNAKLIETLKKLRDLKNTIIVVEHDEAMIRAADWLIDMGPGAGKLGGEVVAQGRLDQILKNKKSLTGKYLSGELKIERSQPPRTGESKFLEIKGAKAYNLKNIDVRLPLAKFICITGVSGSGKSTLVIEILAKSLAHHFYRAKDLPGQHNKILGIENIDKIIRIDQSPIGRTPRSNPATYTGIFTYIRDLFSSLPESQAKGYNAGNFSFNVDGGRCRTCSGEGYVKIEMQFLAAVYIECEACHGKRYSDEVLAIYYKGKNIADVLDLSVSEAMIFFSDIPPLYEKLKTLHSVGLDYLPLGQSATTLSGGEAQRIKLATELSRRSTGKTLYILDEPTTGLHFEDTKRLLVVLNKLVDKGNTIIVIEHHLDVIKCADWIIDLGPEGGNKGGEMVACGTPEEIIKNKKSYTGQYLKRQFNAK